MTNRLLAIDGGGMRGLYAAHVLERIEAKFGVVFHRDFEIIAGTSTGSIIAAALAFDIPLIKVSALYRDQGPAIFCNRPWSIGGMLTPKYSTEPLRSALAEVFGELKLKDAKSRLLIPATDLGNGTVHIFKSAYDPNFVRDSDVRVVDAILASCSAPLFFAPTKTGCYLLCDGGLWANNPSLVLLTEALSRLKIDRRGIRLLSVGTGTGHNYYPLGSRSWLWGFVAGWGMKKFIYMLLNLQTATSTNVTKLLLDDSQIVRVNFESDRPLPLDDPRIIDDMITRADHDFSHSAARIRALLEDSRTI